MMVEQPEQEIAREELAKAFREIVALASGKRVLFWILENAAIYRDAFSGEDSATNYTLGLQASGRKLIAMLDELDPRLYPQLLLDIAELRAMDRAAAKARAGKQEKEDAEE